jgi:hypothetical protein
MDWRLIPENHIPLPCLWKQQQVLHYFLA